MMKMSQFLNKNWLIFIVLEYKQIPQTGVENYCVAVNVNFAPSNTALSLTLHEGFPKVGTTS